jgi:hypothetical protein
VIFNQINLRITEQLNDHVPVIVGILALIPVAPLTDAIVLHPENYSQNSMENWRSCDLAS